MWEQKVTDTAGIILRNETAGIVLCKEDEWWGIPKGRVDPGETPLEAAVREVLEEVSILLSPYGSHVNESVELKTVANNSRGGNFYIFECYVKLPMVLTKSAEHEAVGWFMTHRNMPDNIDPRIKGLL